MNRKQRKWALLAMAGSITGMAMLLFFRSIPLAAGTATAIIAGIIVIKHVALAMIVGSPLAALFQSLKPKIRAHCPFAK
jgi:formate hydrogenlyase subunit 4